MAKGERVVWICAHCNTLFTWGVISGWAPEDMSGCHSTWRGSSCEGPAEIAPDEAQTAYRMGGIDAVTVMTGAVDYFKRVEDAALMVDRQVY